MGYAGAFYHTPLPLALEYGVSWGLEAASFFLLPWGTWLPALLGRNTLSSASAGGTWLRHLARLDSLSELHLDLPLALPAQVRARHACRLLRVAVFSCWWAVLQKPD